MKTWAYTCLSGLCLLSACQFELDTGLQATVQRRQTADFALNLLDPIGPPPEIQNFVLELPQLRPSFDFLNTQNQVELQLESINQYGEVRPVNVSQMLFSDQLPEQQVMRTGQRWSGFSLAQNLQPALEIQVPGLPALQAALLPAGQARSNLQQRIRFSVYEQKGQQLLTDQTGFEISGQSGFLENLSQRSLRLIPTGAATDLRDQTLLQIWLEGVQWPISHAGLADGEVLLDLDSVRRYLFGERQTHQAQVSFRQGEFEARKRELRTVILRQPEAYLQAQAPPDFGITQVRLNNRPVNLPATLSGLTQSQQQLFDAYRTELLGQSNSDLEQYLESKRREFRLALLPYVAGSEDPLSFSARQFSHLRGAGLSLLAHNGQFAERNLSLLTRSADGSFHTYQLSLSADTLRLLARKLNARYFRAQQMQSVKYSQFQQASQNASAEQREAAFRRWTQQLTLAELVWAQGDDLQLEISFRSEPSGRSFRQHRTASAALQDLIRQELTSDLQYELQEALGYLSAESDRPIQLNLSQITLPEEPDWVGQQTNTSLPELLASSSQAATAIQNQVTATAAEELALQALVNSGEIQAEQVVYVADPTPVSAPVSQPASTTSGSSSGGSSGGGSNTIPRENLQTIIEFEF